MKMKTKAQNPANPCGCNTHTHTPDCLTNKIHKNKKI